MMKKAYKLTFQNGKNRLVEDDAPLEHLRAVCLNRYLSDGSGAVSYTHLTLPTTSRV